jgi:hypothetical protein
MIEFDFYDYYEDKDKIKIYGDELHNFFEKYDINIDSVEFDNKSNVVLYIQKFPKIDEKKLEKNLLNKIKHLNDIEIRKTKIVLIFDVKEIEIS